MEYFSEDFGFSNPIGNEDFGVALASASVKTSIPSMPLEEIRRIANPRIVSNPSKKANQRISGKNFCFSNPIDKKVAEFLQRP